MKKLYLILSLIIVSFLMVFAADTVKMLRIYHHGTFSAVPLPNIDSIDHSKIDSNGDLQTVIEAIDSTRRIPVSEIDSVVVKDMEWSVYQDQVVSIGDIMKEQFGKANEMAVETFQTQLLNHLNVTEWVLQATINEQHDMITVQLNCGLDVLINFRTSDYCGVEDETNASTRLFETASTGIKCFDVSSQEGEQIISNPKILLVQGRSMPSLSSVSQSTANEELKGLRSIIYNSPIYNSNNVVPVSKSLDFLDEINKNDYGMVILSQTHGAASGHFQVEDMSRFYSNKKEILIAGYDMRVKNNIVAKRETQLVWWVYPENCIFPRYDTIVYGSYCHSAVRATENDKATVWGYTTVSEYFKQNDYLFQFMEGMMNGQTFQQAIKPLEKGYSFVDRDDKNTYQVLTTTNNPDSKQRYFSITLNELEKKGENVILSGKINGYNNMNPKVVYYIYVSKMEGFEPSSSQIEEGFKNPHKLTHIKSDGSFELEIFEKDLYLNTPYSLLAFIPYTLNKQQRYYHGEIKTYYRNICPDNHHPHLIDLGLPSGTKWACCNLDAQSPGEYGGYYSWGELSTKASYSRDNYNYQNGSNCLYLGDNISGVEAYDAVTFKKTDQCMPSLEDCKELIEHTKITWWAYQNVKGLLFTASNGQSIFLPGSGYRYEDALLKDGNYGGGYYWLSTAYGDEMSNVSYALMTIDGSTKMNFLHESRYMGLTIRPVSK